MKYSNTIEYNISTKLDSSGLTKLQSQIKQLENSMQQMANREFLNSDKVEAAKTQLERLNTALTNSFNSSLGILDLSKFRAELDAGGVSAKGLQSAFSMMGAEGQAALNGLTTQIANFNGGMERTSSAVDKIFTTFSNTFRWGMVSSFFSQFMNAIHSSVDYVKELDDSLTQIMLVTDYNRDSMNEFARSANEAAKAVSMTTTGMTNASLIFAQQGYDLGQSQELATLSAKVANASQQDTATTSDQITAYMNAYGLENSIDELTQAMDNWALIANISAADVSELAQASQRAASMANAVGVSGEQLASQIATIESVTREAPEQIGNGLKTLYARFSDIASGKEDEDGFTLGKVTSELNKIGVQVLDEMGQIRDVGDIMEDLMVIWDDLDQTSKVAASQALAGKYQVNRFMALMDNSDMYEEYKGATGANAAGTLDMMNEEYAQSIEGRSAKLQASLEGLFSTIFNTDDIYPWMDAAQGAVDLLQQFFDALGGGKTVLLGISTLLGQVFNQNIARSINDTIANRNLGKIREQNISSVNDTLDRVGIDRTQGVGAYISKTADQARLGALNEAQYNAYMDDVQQWVNATTALTASEKELQTNVDLINAIYAKAGADGAFKEGKDSPYNTVNLQENRKEVLDKIDNLDFAEQEQAAAQYANSLHQLLTVFKEVEQDTSDEQNKQEELATAIQSAREVLGDFTETLEMSKEEASQWNQAFENVAADLAALPENSIEAEKALGKIYDRVTTLRKKLFEVNNDKEGAKKFVADASDTIQKDETQISFNEAQEKRAGENAKTRGQGIDQQQNIKTILDTINAVQQLTFAWQAFQNLGSIWTNEDLSKGEKILQTIMNLTAGISQVIVAIDNLKNVPKMLDQIQQGYQQWIQKIIDAKNAEIAQQNAERQAAETEYYKAKGSLEAAQAKQQEAQQRMDNAKATNEEAKQEADLAESSLASAVANESVARSRLAKAEAYRAEAAAKRELLMLDAIENNDEAKFNILEKQGRIFDSVNADKVTNAEEQLAQTEQKVADATARVNLANEKVNKSNKEVLEAQKQLTESKNQMAQAQQRLSQAYSVFSALQSKQTQDFIDTISNTEKLTAAFDQMKEKLLGVGNSIKNIGSNIVQFFTSPLGLAVGALAVVAGIAYGMFQDIEKHKQEAIADFEEAKNAQQQVADLSAKIDDWKSKKQSGESNEELINEAKALADEFRALGKETEATNIALAAARAEAQNTAEGYDALEEALTNTQKAVKEDSYLDAMNKAQEVLENQLSTIEEINAARELMLNSGGQLGMQRLADTEGQKMHVFDAQDEATRRAGTEALTEATASWESIDSYLKEIVPGYSEIADEAERLAKAQQWATTEAQKAVITTRELLLANQNLTERGGAYDSRNDYVTAGREGILDQLRNAGFTAEEQLKIVASFDDHATDKEITEGIAKIQEQLKTNPDLTLAIRAALDEDNIKQSVEKQLESYQPKDADVAQEDFQRLTNTFYENKDKMGEEGTPFEDLSETLFTNAEALERLVEGILRYNDAIASIDENYDKWNEALEDNNIFSDEYQDTLDDLQDTYADFLDLSENLSDEFLSNRKNLQKLKDASEGVEGAYEDLEDAAKADIYMNVTGIDNIDIAEEKIKEISNLLSDPEFEAIDVGEAFDISSFPDLEESINNFLLNFKGSAEEAVAAVHDLYGVDIPVNNIVEAGNDAVNAVDSIQNTSQDAVSVVGEMAQGVTDAAQTAAAGLAEGLTGSTEVELNGTTATANDTVQYTNLTPQPGPEQTITSYMPVGNGNTGIGGPGVTMEPFVAHVRGVTYTAESVPVPETKEMTGQQIKSEYKPGSTNGGFTLKPGAMGTKAAPSSAKRSGGARPSSSGGGGGGGKSCFVAGTLISTSFGYKPIELIKPSDLVLSYNESLYQNEYSKVIQTMIHDTIEPIYTLYIKNEQLRVTGIHRFLVSKDISFEPQWIAAQDLQIGDWVLLADNTWHLIWKIEVNLEHQIVYNFEVAGNHNYYVGRNQILAHNKGGSGKSSSPKAKEPKKINPKEKKEHEKDYYEEVDNQISKIEKTLSNIEKQEDRLVGTKARANQNRQINLLKKEIKLQQEKLEILEKQEQVDVWKALKDKDKEAQDLLNANGIFLDIPDAHVDGDGIIENYEEISAAIDKAHNELIDKYNAAAAASNEEETKRLDEQIKKFDDLGKSILKNSQRANEIRVEIEDINGTIEELKYNIQDIQNKAYEAARESQKKIVELKEDAAELKGIFRDFDDNSFVNAFSIDDTPYQDLITSLEKLDTIYNVSKDDATAYYDNLIQKQEALKESTTDPAIRKAAEDTIRFYREQQALLSDEDSLENGELGRATRELEMLKRWIDNPDAEDNIFKNDEATLWKMYEEASKDAKEAFEDFREEVQNYRDSILDIYDDQEDAIDRQIDQFDRLTEKIERISDTYKLYYGEDSYDQLDKFYAQQGNVMQNQLNQLTAAYNHWQDQYQKALNTGDKELIQEIQDKMNDAEDAMLDAAQELAELWVEKFENAVEASSQHIYKNLFGSNDIDELTDNWELQKDYMDRYKDDVEKAYEIDKLRSKYINLLNDAQGSSAQTQNRIRQQMQEQLDLLQNQATVSEYDVKLANAKLEILQKQMALEDAQRNKNKMQLRRDTQGNYRYVYTADQGNVAEAQQDLENSEYDAYEMTKNETVANNDRAINLLQDYIQKRAAIWNKYKDDATARGQALAELEAEYEKTFDALAEDFTDTSNGMYDILNWLVKNGSEDTTTAAIEMLDTLYDKNGEIKDKTGQDWMDLASMIQDQVLPKITDAVTKADLELEDQAVSLKDSMTGPNGALTKIGSSAEDVGNSMDAAAEATRDLASATEELFTALGADDGKLQKALDKVSQYESQLQKTQSTTSSLANQLGVANQTIAAKTAESNNYRTTLDYLTGAKDFEAGQDIRLKKGAYVTYHRDGKTQWDSEGKGGFNIPRDMTVHIFDPNEQLNGSDAPNNVAVYPIDAEGWGPKRWEEYTMTTDQQQHQMWHINKDTAKKFLAYDTGGYTGEWNDSSENLATGKVALLHQKELVLNATDTENILNAVNIMRDITDSIKNANSYISAFKTGNFTGNQEIIKQRVEISATFPNVSSITDIEQALMNLSDQAYIYANKTI